MIPAPPAQANRTRSALTAVLVGFIGTVLVAGLPGCAASETTHIAQTAETIRPVGSMIPDAVLLGAREDFNE